jgi:phosphoadenosine phosphosulfate reductase
MTALLEQVAFEAGQRLEDASAQDVVAWAVDTFGDRFAVTSSMADAVLVHVVQSVRPGVDVLFLDTGYHFAETLGTRDAVAATYDVTVRTLRPAATVEEQDATFGPRLYERDPDACCALRKVAPLEQALAGYDAWASGLRRDESPTRAGTPVVGWDERRGKVKVNPLARWTQADVDAYVERHGVLLNPLLLDGYGSIGCAPCTRRVSAGDDARAGRWAGLSKTECGIHL